MSFEELGLNKFCVNNLVTHGIISPTSIQKAVFSPLQQGRSVVALSKTGTGKTLAYLAPIVQRYTYDVRQDDLSSKPWGLILVPTRELADQVSKNLKVLAQENIKSVVIVGGESEKKQIDAGQVAQLYVATPGRFLDLLQRKLVDVDHLKVAVFDEADRILDMGFIDDIRAIRKLLPHNLQMCFFSATLHFGVDEMAYEFGVEVDRIGKEADEVTVEGLDHQVAFVGDHEKFHALVHFLFDRKNERGIVFTNFRDKAHELVSRLRGLGFKAESLTAQLNQSQRSRSMQDFRDGKTQVLVASDLASRGLDVEALDFVLNYDLPEDSATYVHRVGRTARAGKRGKALSLVGFDDTFRLEKLTKFLGREIQRYQFPTQQLTGALPSLRVAVPRPQPQPQPKPKPVTAASPHRSTSSQARPERQQPRPQITSKQRSPVAKPQNWFQKILEKIKVILGRSPKVTKQEQSLPGPRSYSNDKRRPPQRGQQRRHQNYNGRGRRLK